MEERKLNIIFRCDANKKIGMGHLFRCIPIAKRISLKSKRIIFLGNYEIDAIKIIKNYGFEIYEIRNILEQESEYIAIYKACKKFRVDSIIFDIRTGFKRDQISKIKKFFNVKIFLIDDSNDRRLASDFCFYPPVKQFKKLTETLC